MTRAAFNRMLLAIHGQSDDLATRPNGCTGSCHQGRTACDCIVSQTELANVIPLRPELPCVPIAITGGRVPRMRRVRRFLRALFHFLTARKADLS